MDAMELLLNRVSCGRLQEPAPGSEQRASMYAAAARAADHGNLRPWRFLEIEGDGLDELGRLLVQASLEQNPQMTEAEIERLAAKPRRAPLIVAAIARHTPHPKVPQWEQTIAAGCAVQNLINAAFAQGIGAYWRTGAMVENETVLRGLELAENEKLIGFVYLGTPSMTTRVAGTPKPSDYVRRWPTA